MQMYHRTKETSSSSLREEPEYAPQLHNLSWHAPLPNNDGFNGHSVIECCTSQAVSACKDDGDVSYTTPRVLAHLTYQEAGMQAIDAQNAA